MVRRIYRKGEESEVVDVMQFLWSGNWPKNKAPHLYSLKVNNKKAIDDIYLSPGDNYNAVAVVADPDNDKLFYRWELMPEPTQLSTGGDFEARPKSIDGMVTPGENGNATFKAPDKEGAYRLFVYIMDGNNNVATANVPFYIKK
jgi:hypothetical protein